MNTTLFPVLYRILTAFLCTMLIAFGTVSAVSADMDGDGITDGEDTCPFIYNPNQDFLGGIGCRDLDFDGFEDMFYDECPGYFGGNRGCPEAQYMQLLAVNGELPGVQILDACILPNTMILPDDYVMIQLDTGDGETPILSDPIRIE